MAVRVAASVVQDGDDDSVGAADSPNLERQRMWQARIKRLEYLERRGLLVRVDRVNQLMATIGATLRCRLENLCDVCRAIIDGTLDEAADQYEQELPQFGELGEEDYGLLDEEEDRPDDVDFEPGVDAGSEPAAREPED